MKPNCKNQGETARLLHKTSHYLNTLPCKKYNKLIFSLQLPSPDITYRKCVHICPSVTKINTSKTKNKIWRVVHFPRRFLLLDGISSKTISQRSSEWHEHRDTPVLFARAISRRQCYKSVFSCESQLEHFIVLAMLRKIDALVRINYRRVIYIKKLILNNHRSAFT